MSHPPRDSDPMRFPRLLLLAAALAVTTGCQPVKLAGRAPTAPALQPVSTQTIPVRLGTSERLTSTTAAVGDRPTDGIGP